MDSVYHANTTYMCTKCLVTRSCVAAATAGGERDKKIQFRAMSERTNLFRSLSFVVVDQLLIAACYVCCSRPSTTELTAPVCVLPANGLRRKC